MKAILDTNMLICFLHPDAPSRTERTAERVTYLLQRLDETRVDIVVPAPVLAELLLYTNADEGVVESELLKIPRVEFGAFDEAVAVELARIARILKSPRVSKSEFVGSRSRLKFDKLIVAIAYCFNSPTLYSDDENVMKIAKRIGIEVISSSQLPLPPQEQQQHFEFDARA